MTFNIDFWLIVSIPAYILFMIFALIGSVLVANRFDIIFLPQMVLISMSCYLLLVIIKIVQSSKEDAE